MSEKYYLLVNGEEKGPFSKIAACSLLAQDSFAGSLVRNEDLWRTPEELELIPQKSSATVQPPTRPKERPVAADNPPSFEVLDHGHMKYTGSYKDAFSLTRQAMVECGVSIKDESYEKGVLNGKSKYGINPFGMSINGDLYTEGESTRVEISASFTDAIDTFGACKKKVDEITERLRLMSGSSSSSTSWGELGEMDFSPAARQRRKRIGPSHKGKAVTGFILGVGGLLFSLFAGLAALILSISALIGISRSNNKSGKVFAIIGVILGAICALLLGARFLLAYEVPFSSITGSWTDSAYVEACTNHYSKLGQSLNDIGLANNRSSWSQVCRCISDLDNGETAEDFQRNTSTFMQAHLANFAHCSR